MYKPSKIKHPSARRSGKKKKGEPAYASSPTISVGPELEETSAEELAYGNASAGPESTTGKRAHAEAPIEKPAAAESTTDQPTAAAPAPTQQPEGESRTNEESHKPVLNADEQKKVVNSSGSATNDDSEEF